MTDNPTPMYAVVLHSAVHPTCSLSLMARVERSTLMEKASAYRMATVADSTLGPLSSVGDGAKADHADLADHVRLGRYSYITHSTMGRHSYTGPSTMILHSEIGSFCSISWGVTIGPGEHDFTCVTSHSFLYDPADGFDPTADTAYDRFDSPCVLGNDVWVGSNATILRGVTVGDGAVIGANALVNRDVPPYAIVAGVPAKVIRMRFDEPTVRELLKLRWWDLPDDEIKQHMELFRARPDSQVLAALAGLKTTQSEVQP